MENNVRNKSSKNGEIELLRFLFAFGIMTSHYQAVFKFDGFSHGAIGVEFFFLVSGLFMARSSERAINSELSLGGQTWNFIKRKICVFYPYFLLAMTLQMFFWRIVGEHWGIFHTFEQIIKAIPQLLLTEISGANVGTGVAISGRWYLSAMVLAMAVLYPVLVSRYDLSAKVLFPLIGIFSLGYLQVNYEGIMRTSDWNGYVFTGLIRAFAEISCGVVCYEIAKAIRAKRSQLTKLAVIVLSISKIFCFFFVALYVSDIIRVEAIITFVLIAVGLILIYSEVGISLPPNKVSDFAGKLALPLYLIHVPVRDTLRCWFGDEKMASIVPLIMLIAIFAAFVMLLLVELIRKNKSAIIGLFVKYDTSV